MTLEERFWSMTDKCGADDCWLWRGHTHGRGAFHYGRLSDGRHRKVSAHRYSYELAHGPIPDGFHVHHICHNTLCVNPAHLVAMPATDHKRLIQNQNAKKTHCPKGHPLSGGNLIYHDASGSRRCKTCHRIANVEYRRRIRERSGSAAAW